MLRRIGEVVRTILSLVESVAQLKAKNDVLSAQVDELRREVDQQAGQVKVLMEFVRSALDDRVEKRAQAAARAVLVDYEAKANSKSRGKRK
jgi:cell division protein FtsB